MPDLFVNYKSFNDKAMAVELYERLKQHGLPVQWEDTVGLFDVSFANDEFMHTYYVKLRKEDFEKADEIVYQAIAGSNDKPPADYYLYTFTNEELMDVMKKPDEWNEYDRYWAGKILGNKNIHIKEEEIAEARIRRFDELKKPWKSDKVWLLLSIVLLLWGFYYMYFIATIGAMLLGMYIAYSKKTMPDGERVQAFSDKDRFWGRIVMIAGILVTSFIFLLIFRVIQWDWYWDRFTE